MKGFSEWIAVYEGWVADEDATHDEQWVEQLAAVAILHRLPCYEDGVNDCGSPGWRRLAARYAGSTPKEADEGQGHTQGGRQNEDEARGLPWETQTTNDKGAL